MPANPRLECSLIDLLRKFVEEYNPSDKLTTRPEMQALTLWLTTDDKKMFEELQEHTKKKFGRAFTVLLCKALRLAHAKTFGK